MNNQKVGVLKNEAYDLLFGNLNNNKKKKVPKKTNNIKTQPVTNNNSILKNDSLPNIEKIKEITQNFKVKSNEEKINYAKNINNKKDKIYNQNN